MITRLLRSLGVGIGIVLDELEARAVDIIAELHMPKIKKPQHIKLSASPNAGKVTRLLRSYDRETQKEHAWVISGTEDDILGSAKRMVKLTRNCVMICVVLGHYHGKECDEYKPGAGFDYERSEAN